MRVLARYGIGGVGSRGQVGGRGRGRPGECVCGWLGEVGDDLRGSGLMGVDMGSSGLPHPGDPRCTAVSLAILLYTRAR